MSGGIVFAYFPDRLLFLGIMLNGEYMKSKRFRSTNLSTYKKV